MDRLVDALIAELLTLFPCIALLGPRQCGKTTALGKLGKQWQRFDLERAADHTLVEQDPDAFLRLHTNLPLAIDEAQLLPQLFPALRVAIDQRRAEPGRFLITGSSSPQLQKNLAESLAGRIAIVEMSPLTLAEIEGTRNQLLLELITSPGLPVPTKQITVERLELIQEFLYQGGYPEPWLKSSARFRSLWKENFVRTYLERDLAPLFPGIQPQRFRTFLGLLASVSGSVLNLSDLARALGCSQPTVKDYLEIAQGTFLWRRLLPFERNVTRRIVKHPYGHLRDTGLIHHLLHIPNSQALATHVVIGRSWQTMVVEEVLRTLEGAGLPFEAFFYRTAAGAEIDLVLDGDFGLLPIEIKKSSHLTARELRSVKDFMLEHNCRRGLVIYGGERLVDLDHGLVALPFGLF